MNFDFNLSTTKPTATVRKRLAPWGIHEVKFKEARIETFQGKKDPSQEYKVIKVAFEGVDGYYEHTIFWIRPDDVKRPTFTNKEGHEMEMPSSWEQTRAVITQVTAVLNPEGFKKMQERSPKYKSFDDMANDFIAIVNKVKDTKTFIKLVGRIKPDGTTDVTIPRIVSINREGELYTSDNFIGDKLFFTPYEQTKKLEFESRKPTTNIGSNNASNDILSAPTPSNDFDDLNDELDSLDLDL